MSSFLVVIFAFVLLPSSHADAPTISPSIGKVVGKLGEIKGEVWVDTKKVSQAANVREGSVVEVKKGNATLLLGQGSVFHLAADTKIVVKQYGIDAATKDEAADLDLAFGKTRALILKMGNKKNLNIKTHAATMGVRGTEVYIDAPKDARQPAQFFVIEGKAEVMTAPGVAPVVLVQNQGVVAGGTTASGAANTATSGGKSATQVNADIKDSGLESPAIKTPQDLTPVLEVGSMSDHITVPTFPLGVGDRGSSSIIFGKPVFCNASTGC